VTGAPPAAGPGDEDGPVFDEPWQADAFAMTQALLEAGVVTSAEWMSALADAIAAHQRDGDPDDGDTYYEHWLAALEAVCTAKGLAPPDEVDARAEQWRQAYLNTPHGRPVELGAARSSTPSR
jgi:nitrile hydratase accessory protein